MNNKLDISPTLRLCHQLNLAQELPESDTCCEPRRGHVAAGQEGYEAKAWCRYWSKSELSNEYYIYIIRLYL
jgi:hypothetical protein